MFIEKIQESLKSVPEYTTFPKTFEKYKWYKPLLVLIVGIIVYTVLNVVMIFLGAILPGTGGINGVIAGLSGGYDSLNAYTYIGLISILSVAVILPSLYVASKIIRDRPFSSYSTSRKKWNWNIFFKSVALSAVVLLILTLVDIPIHGFQFNNHFTILTFILCLIITPIQCTAEEYLLRGYVMQTIGSWFGIPILAIVVQAAIFAAAHPYNILGVIGTLVTGISFGIITYYSKGLEMSSGIHSVNNIFTFCMSGFGISAIKSNIDMSSFIMDILFFIIITVLILYLSNKQDWFKNTEG